MSDRKAVIKNADMSEDMQQDAVDCATQAMEKYNIEKDIAAYIKKVRWTWMSLLMTTVMNMDANATCDLDNQGLIIQMPKVFPF